MLQQITGYFEQMHFRFMDDLKAQRFQFPNIGNAASLFILLGAVLLWSAALPQIDLRQMDDTGLISVLPLSALLALAFVNLSFCLAISRRPLYLPLLVLHFIVLVLMLYGTPAIIQEDPRFAIGWKLAGIMDYVMKT